MLDANEVLKELEELLEEGYTQLCERNLAQVQVTEQPMQAPSSLPALPVPQPLPVPSTPTPKLNPISEFVANACLLVFLTLLSDRLANQ